VKIPVIVDKAITMWHINFPKLRKTMKKLFEKIIQCSTVILISWTVVYGIVYAQQACSSTIVDACIPTLSRISDSYAADSFCRTSPSHHRNNKLQSNLCSKNIPADFGEGNTCCETNRCDSNNKAVPIYILTQSIIC